MTKLGTRTTFGPPMVAQAPDTGYQHRGATHMNPGSGGNMALISTTGNIREPGDVEGAAKVDTADVGAFTSQA